jgi:hypothetical protein
MRLPNLNDVIVSNELRAFFDIKRVERMKHGDLAQHTPIRVRPTVLKYGIVQFCTARRASSITRLQTWRE